MPEQPTLTLIGEIAAGDVEFEKKLIAIIQKELPEEIELYNKNFEDKDYLKVAGNVHKLNHKINIFGLKDGYETAVTFENDLRNGNSELKFKFDEILENMTRFLNSIEAPKE